MEAELWKKAADYRRLAEAEPHDGMRDMLQRVADALDEILANRKTPHRYERGKWQGN